MKKIYTSFVLLACMGAFAQNTVGTTLNTAEALQGYTLFSPVHTTLPDYTYLIDNCGRVVNSWESPNHRNAQFSYLNNDGTMVKSVFDNASTLFYGGVSGGLQKFDWDGSLLWSARISDTDYSFHHDYVQLPNGNLLIMVAYRMTNQEALDAGRNPSTLTNDNGALYDERIQEIELVGNNAYNIVWEWRLWDHLVQDFDNTKNNFDNPADHPELLDVNYIGSILPNVADWWHLNAMDYNPVRDEIVVSSRFLSEIYIIDHSTTTAEAAGHTGGNRGKGGDFLFRWGNPAAYRAGTGSDQQFFGQHGSKWITQGSNQGKIIVFNNGNGRGYSTVNIINPSFDVNGNYLMANGTFLPVTSDYVWENEPVNTDFFATFLSNATQLPNNNIFVNNGPRGIFFEVDENGNKVWEYKIPIIGTGILSQGDPHTDIRITQAEKYSADHPAFSGRDLTPQAEIELNPQPQNCQLFLSTDTVTLESIVLYPNPVSNQISWQSQIPAKEVQVIDLSGKVLVNSQPVNSSIDVSTLAPGVYIVKITSEKASFSLSLIHI